MNTTTQPEYTTILDVEDIEEIKENTEIESSEGNHPTEGEMSFAAIYRRLLEFETLSLTINTEDEKRLRKGLTDIKYANNQKLIKSGLTPNNRRIDFTTLKKNEETGTSEIMISLAKGAGIVVLGIDNQIQERM
jgi:hypothetical protein